MSNTQTPRPRLQLGARPSLLSTNITTASSPNLNFSASTAMARKASLNALTGTPSRGTPRASDVDIDVGDVVDVPGNMHGTVKFIGTVRGKKGTFAGVELSREFAARGKNDGDVEGVRYFTTSVPGSGIFLPVHRATRRASLNGSDGSFPPTPITPHLGSFGFDRSVNTPPVHAMPKFSQSVGPGARPPSPLGRTRASRPSLPRPESPLRRPPNIPPPSSRGPSTSGPQAFSRSQLGTPKFSPSPAPRTMSPGKAKTPLPSRPYSRNSSRLGIRKGSEDETGLTNGAGAITRSSDGSGAGTGSVNSGGSTLASATKAGAQEEIRQLKKSLEDRDKQLKEQASHLAEMESSLTELQSLLPQDGSGNHGEHEDGDVSQLRAVIREKNEKISMLTAEFDNHRADFRSTIDTLEMASTETARVYEQRVEELMQELKELQDSREDVDGITRQFKQLEDLVTDLEEGLEDARRGEAEARGEVEFLRGEVERGRSELRREREAAAQLAAQRSGFNEPGAKESRDIEQRDDEIRGLKAIIHSLSSGGDVGGSRSPRKDRSGSRDESSGRMHANLERLEREKKDLQSLVERKAQREEELERELDRLRGGAAGNSGGLQQRGSVISNGLSDRTIQQDSNQHRRSSTRDSKGTIVGWTVPNAIKLPTMAEVESAPPSSTGSGVLWCEICEQNGHDILTCTNMDKTPPSSSMAPSYATMRTEISTMSSNAIGIHRFRGDTVSSQDPDMPRPLLTTSSSYNSSNNGAPPSSIHTNGSLSNNTHNNNGFNHSSSNNTINGLGNINKRLPNLPALPGAAPTAPLPNPLDAALVAGKDGSRPDPNKWCALCERDGHDSINCAFEDEY